MSVKAITWAFEQTITDPEETKKAGKPIADARAKLLLIALADHADDDGLCWPSIARLAVKASISRSTVYRKLAELERHGFIVAREKRFAADGSQTSSFYTLNIEPPPYQAETPPVPPKEKRPPVPYAATHNHQLEPSLELLPPVGGSPSKGKLSDEDFAKFWNAYPPGRKVEKKAVRAKLETVLRRGEATLELIVAGARRYAAARSADPHGPKYTKAPLVWLNRGCWDDEIDDKTNRDAGGFRWASGIEGVY